MSDGADGGTVLAVSVGGVRQVPTSSRVVETGIWKAPVRGRVAVRGVNLDGDDQADRTVHGGPDKAVYAYASEDTAWWEAQLGRELGPGAFGENLTTAAAARGSCCPWAIPRDVVLPALLGFKDPATKPVFRFLAKGPEQEGLAKGAATQLPSPTPAELRPPAQPRRRAAFTPRCSSVRWAPSRRSTPTSAWARCRRR